MKLSRREFVRHFTRQAGCFAAVAAATPLVSCVGSGPLESGEMRPVTFPQGVASADPQPDAVMLWTRAQPAAAPVQVSLDLQVATDPGFLQIVVEKAVVAHRNKDYTLRCFVSNLVPARYYYYRFVARGDDLDSSQSEYAGVSRAGRTRTAPRHDADVPLRLAVFSCQDYEQGFFTAYRHLLQRDRAGESIDLCLHVGDFIYEWTAGQIVDLNRQPVDLRNPDGRPRRVGPFPSGGAAGKEGRRVPRTLADYRTLYRQYLSDADLQEARARFPFVYIWDDHEVVNDYWQSYAGNSGIQTLKVFANQAWFEYMPALLDQAPPGAAGYHGAKSFRPAEVVDTPPAELDENYLSREANNQAAIGSLGIYRSLRWGRHVDLLLVDGRSFRGPRGVETNLLSSDGLAAYPNRPLDPALVQTLNEGRTANDGRPPDRVVVNGREFENPRKAAPCASLFGRVQKQWLKDSLQNSEATWRVLCNNVPMMRFGFDTRMSPNGYRNGLYWTDSWDGYPVERRELMDFIRAYRLTNIVSITGDRHANFAGTVLADVEQPGSPAVIPEFVGTGVSAPCRAWVHDVQFRDLADLHKRTTFDGSRYGYRYKIGPNLNTWLLFGAEAAAVMHDSLDTAAALAHRRDDVNPHLVYADTDAFGYYTVTFKADRIDGEFVVLPEPIKLSGSGRVEERRRVAATVRSWAAGEQPAVDVTQTRGEAPLLGLREAEENA